MRLGVLFSGGKDSMYATWMAKKEGYDVSCLIVLESKNKESYMFHTPSISKTKEQAKVMGIPITIIETKGEKETELEDLEFAIKSAIKEFGIEGVVTGAIESVYQASRVQKICNKLKIECFNPLWQKNRLKHLNELILNKFEVILTGVFAYPLDKKWLGRKIDKKFIEDITKLKEKYGIDPVGEGGEFESFVLNCPLFEKSLQVKSFDDFGEGNSWRREVKLK